MHENIKLRSEVISFIRSKMIENNFLEFLTPIYCISPKGPGIFSTKQIIQVYALPQAPQQFKQMVMILALIDIFRLHHAEMKMDVPIEAQVNTINWI